MIGMPKIRTALSVGLTASMLVVMPARASESGPEQAAYINYKEDRKIRDCIKSKGGKIVESRRPGSKSDRPSPEVLIGAIIWAFLCSEPLSGAPARPAP